MFSDVEIYFFSSRNYDTRGTNQNLSMVKIAALWTVPLNTDVFLRRL